MGGSAPAVCKCKGLQVRLDACEQFEAAQHREGACLGEEQHGPRPRSAAACCALYALLQHSADPLHAMPVSFGDSTQLHSLPCPSAPLTAMTLSLEVVDQPACNASDSQHLLIVSATSNLALTSSNGYLL